MARQRRTCEPPARRAQQDSHATTHGSATPLKASSHLPATEVPPRAATVTYPKLTSVRPSLNATAHPGGRRKPPTDGNTPPTRSPRQNSGAHESCRVQIAPDPSAAISDASEPSTIQSPPARPRVGGAHDHLPPKSRRRPREISPGRYPKDRDGHRPAGEETSAGGAEPVPREFLTTRANADRSGSTSVLQ